MQKHQGGLEAWLNTIHRYVRNNRRQDKKASRFPVAVLQHLWHVGLDHKRWSIRRCSTLFLAGKLLEKSADCRKWWLEDDSRNLVEWMDAVLSEEETEAPVKRLWQREVYEMLIHLESKGYGDYYPTLSVAVQRFQQLSHVSMVVNNTVTRRMRLHNQKALRSSLIASILFSGIMMRRKIKGMNHQSSRLQESSFDSTGTFLS
jgi:hypothetical protein